MEKEEEKEKALGRAASRQIGREKMWRMSERTGVGERVGEEANEREREGREEEKEEEVEEEGVEEVEDIFRAAPNQLLRQFVSVGAKGRAGEREPRKFNTKNQYAAHSLTESSGQRGRDS